MIRLFTVFLLFCSSVVWGASPKFRPLSGNGVLFIVASDRDNQPVVIPLYQAPGVGRIRTMKSVELPALSQVMEPPQRELLPVAVFGKKGQWLKVAMDEAGSEGWLAPEWTWRYRTWEEYLRGRTFHPLPGLAKDYYSLRAAPERGAREQLRLSRQDRLKVTAIDADWAFVETPRGSGWLRWRDDNGRFLIWIDSEKSR